MKSFVRLMKPLIEKFPTLAHLYRYNRNYRALRKEPLYRDSLGFRFNGPLVMESGLFEPEETKIFESAMQKFDVLINIGSNVGYYCLKALYAGKEVYAFEPNELNVKILLNNVLANAWQEKFNIYPIALGYKTCILPLYGDSTGASLIEGWAGQKTSSLIPVNTLDKVIGNQLDYSKVFVLIDVEGAELDCLKGAGNFLKNTRNAVLMIEINIIEHQPENIKINPYLKETFQYLFSYGFRAYKADYTLREIDINEIQEIESTNIDTIKKHNFLFLRHHMSLSDVGLS